MSIDAVLSGEATHHVAGERVENDDNTCALMARCEDAIESGALGLPRTIVADPPWLPRLHAHTVGRRKGKYRAGPQRYYKSMSLEEIAALRPPSAKKAHLWLWCLNQHIDWGYIVARAWGFEPQQTLTWCKPGLGTGRFQSNSEQVLICRKGGPVDNAFGPTGGTWFDAPRGRHSAKPDRFYEIVERASPGPRLELFARVARPGWVAVGDQLELNRSASGLTTATGRIVRSAPKPKTPEQGDLFGGAS